MSQVQLGSPWRLQTIFVQTCKRRTCRAIPAPAENVDDRPYWKYVAILDSRTRPSHRALNGKVFRYDDSFWSSFYPPNGWDADAVSLPCRPTISKCAESLSIRRRQVGNRNAPALRKDRRNARGHDLHHCAS
ncbi:phage head morphogenesis protein [Pandoraea norimbergensis]|uniref:phage head morphogenesis protein n=1 Tax=Pandoraea norimbergensis TaxID=93219 RepID=UPI001EED7C1D|nr:phage minor head protein [Pandoraea norimbergensis]